MKTIKQTITAGALLAALAIPAVSHAQQIHPNCEHPTTMTTQWRCQRQRAKHYGRYGVYQLDGQLPRDWRTPYPLAGGIPVVHYPQGFTARNPVTSAQYGLASYSLWIRYHDRWRLQIAEHVADWLIRTQTSDGTWRYTFPFTVASSPPHTPPAPLKPGWDSALAQSQAISLMERIYHVTGKAKYLISAAFALKSLQTPVRLGGLLRHHFGGTFFEEYVTPGQVDITLNGDMQTLIGLYDVSGVIPAAHTLFEKGAASLAANVQRWASGETWSDYSLVDAYPPPQTYHPLIRAELRILSTITGRKVFAHWATVWTYPGISLS